MSDIYVVTDDQGVERHYLAKDGEDACEAHYEKFPGSIIVGIPMRRKAQTMTEYNVFSADGELLHTGNHASASLAVASHNQVCDCDLATSAVAVQSIRDIAAKIDPWDAQIAVAQAMQAMGSQREWDSETIELVAAPMVAIGKKIGLPSFTNADVEGSCEFWQSVE